MATPPCSRSTRVNGVANEWKKNKLGTGPVSRIKNKLGPRRRITCPFSFSLFLFLYLFHFIWYFLLLLLSLLPEFRNAESDYRNGQKKKRRRWGASLVSGYPKEKSKSRLKKKEQSKKRTRKKKEKNRRWNEEQPVRGHSTKLKAARSLIFTYANELNRWWPVVGLRRRGVFIGRRPASCRFVFFLFSFFFIPSNSDPRFFLFTSIEMTFSQSALIQRRLNKEKKERSATTT